MCVVLVPSFGPDLSSHIIANARPRFPRPSFATTDVPRVPTRRTVSALQ